MTHTVPPSQSGDRIFTALAHAVQDPAVSGLRILTTAIIAAEHPELTPEAAAEAAAEVNELSADASRRARAILEQVARAAEAATVKDGA